MAARVASVAMAVQLAVSRPVRAAAAMDTMAAKEAMVATAESAAVVAGAPAAMRDRPWMSRWSVARKCREQESSTTQVAPAVLAAAVRVAQALSVPRDLAGIQACSGA